MNGIFISYRREDSAFETGILRERLANHFHSDLLFTDIDSIPLGVDFRAHIDAQVRQCDIFLVVIGRGWLGAADADGQPRLQNSEDFVRLEIEAALSRDIPVVPLLLGDTQIPSAEELPESLRALAFRNGTPIRPLPTFDEDVKRLIRGIDRHTESKAKAQDGEPIDSANSPGEPDSGVSVPTEPVEAASTDQSSERKAEKERARQAKPEEAAATVTEKAPTRRHATPAATARRKVPVAVVVGLLVLLAGLGYGFWTVEQGRQEAVTRLLGEAAQAVAAARFEDARSFVDQANGIKPGAEVVARAYERLEFSIQQAAQEAKIKAAEERQRLAALELERKADAIRLAKEEAEIEAAKAEEERQRHAALELKRKADAKRQAEQEAEGKAAKAAEERQRLAALALERNVDEEARRPGHVFRDALAGGGQGPDMVVMPGGTFWMGSPDSEKGRDSDETRRKVAIAGFSISKYEITFAQYDAFCDATKRKKPRDRGSGRGNQPVIYVSWHDATAYAKWISTETGKNYRLPSEEEWEYAARAGTTTRYWWGSDIGKKRANCRHCGSKWDGKQAAPVGSFEPNPFGLYDTAGNVWEWTASRYKSGRVVRGGSWFDSADLLRSANRSRNGADGAVDDVGFRLARAN